MNVKDFILCIIKSIIKSKKNKLKLSKNKLISIVKITLLYVIQLLLLFFFSFSNYFLVQQTSGHMNKLDLGF